MKKVIFGLIATVFMVNLSWGQKESTPTKEEVRIITAEVFIKFKNGLREDYLKSKDYNSFLSNIYGTTKPTTVQEGKNLLQAAYNHLSKKTSDDELRRTFDGKVVASAFVLMNSNKSSENNLFNITPNYPTTRGFLSDCGCRWWQFGCIWDCITQIVTDAVISILESMM
jgi:hypothetical protein